MGDDVGVREGAAEVGRRTLGLGKKTSVWGKEPPWWRRTPEWERTPPPPAKKGARCVEDGRKAGRSAAVGSWRYGAQSGGRGAPGSMGGGEREERSSGSERGEEWYLVNDCSASG